MPHKTVTLTEADLCELVFTAAGAATGPLMRDNPEYVFPSERVAEAVTLVIEEHTPVKVADVPGYAGAARQSRMLTREQEGEEAL